MSESVRSDIEKFLETKKGKAVVQFKTGNLFKEPALCTIVERRRVTSWIKKQISNGGFVVNDYWIRKTPDSQQVYTALLVESLSCEDLLAFVCETLQCETHTIAHALQTTHNQMLKLEGTIKELITELKTTDLMIAGMCKECLPSNETCRKRTCPLWPMSPRGSWRSKPSKE